jgi:hypothetical protein
MTGKDAQMKNGSGLLYPVALAVLLSTGLTARASLVQWSYDWDRSPSVLLAGTGGVTLTNEPGASAAGSSDVVVTNLKVFSSATATAPDTLTNGAYTLTLKLTDIASQQSTLLTFKGMLSGTFSSGSAHITNVFVGGISQTVTLGGNSYTVNLGAYSPPGPPTASNSGSLSAHINVVAGGSHGGGGGGPPATPEPSSAVLAGLGVLGLICWGRWRRGKNLAVSLA